MPHRQCRKSTAIFLYGVICLFLWQASIYPVLGKGSELRALPAIDTTKFVVQRGDTLWDLAQRFQTTVEELVSLNQLKSPNQIGEGQSILIPNREIPEKTEDPQIVDIMVYREEVSKTVAEVPVTVTEVKTAENVSSTPWWVSVMRKIPFFAGVIKQNSLAPTSIEAYPSQPESKILTYEIFVNQNTEPTKIFSMSELADIKDDRSKLVNNEAAFIMTSDNRIHSRGLGRFVTKEEVELLTRVIYGEARGEDFLGQVAVGAVVLNRLKDPRFPKTIRSIVYQSGAFTAVNDRQIHLDPNNQAYKAAEAALSGLDPTNGAIFYYNPRLATDDWIKSRTVVKRIGNHTFSI